MSLSTHSKQTIAPPVTVEGSDDLTPSQAGSRNRNRVSLASISDQGILNIRGREARRVLAQAYDTEEMDVGQVRLVAEGTLACLRPDECVLLISDVQAALNRLKGVSSSRLLTLTDVTHGRAMLLLMGLRAADVLSKVCGLDFSVRRFPDHSAAQTMLAKVRALVIRADMGELPVYTVVVDRSLAAYVWEVVYDAAREFSGLVLSKDALRKLRERSDG
jgi:heterotetrameric sarcosine oxidase gamma subunit